MGRLRESIMTHLWVRAEQRANEQRVGITPEGAAHLITQGMQVSVEESSCRALPIEGYREAGCHIVAENSWVDAPENAIIFGLKELPADGTPLRHRHIMFGHAFKGQHEGQVLLQRFRAGGGMLLDLEYLMDEAGTRLAAFGYWAGYAGAALSLQSWLAQQQGGMMPPARVYTSSEQMLEEIRNELSQCVRKPRVIVIGFRGRAGQGAMDLCQTLHLPTTGWDRDDTVHGGPFPKILEHDIFLNCIFANETTPVFVSQASVQNGARVLSVIGDIACDPDSDYNPIPLYKEATTWLEPVVRVAEHPPLDIMAIDNLPSLLPIEASQDYAAQLLPVLLQVGDVNTGVWRRAQAIFRRHRDAL